MGKVHSDGKSINELTSETLTDIGGGALFILPVEVEPVGRRNPTKTSRQIPHEIVFGGRMDLERDKARIRHRL